MNHNFAYTGSRIFLATIVLLFSTISAPTQDNTKTGGDRPDNVCYVYVVDVLKAREVMEIFQKTGDIEELKKAKAKLNPEIMFPPIKTVFDEEELTTKHYTFPGSKLTITANIYYTDESPMGTTIQAGVAVSEKPQENVLFNGLVMNGAVAEVVLSDFTDRFSAKQYVRVNNRLYRLGIECDCFGRQRIKTVERLDVELVHQRRITG